MKRSRWLLLVALVIIPLAAYAAGGGTQSASDASKLKALAGGVSKTLAQHLQALYDALGLQITSVSPASGPVGTSVTVAGSGFSTSGTTVAFNGIAATPTTVTTTSITVAVPSGATTGPLTVTVGARTVSSTFTVTTGTQPPAISGLTLAPASTSIQANWTTDIASDSTLLWGTTTSLSGSAVTSSTLTTTGHNLILSGLSASTTYYLQAKSCAAGVCGTSSVISVITTGSAGITIPATVVSPCDLGDPTDATQPGMTVAQASGYSQLTERGTGAHYFRCQLPSAPTIGQGYKFSATIIPGARTQEFMQLQGYGASSPACTFDFTAATASGTNGATCSLGSPTSGAYPVSISGSFPTATQSPPSGQPYYVAGGTMVTGSPSGSVAFQIKDMAIIGGPVISSFANNAGAGVTAGTTVALTGATSGATSCSINNGVGTVSCSSFSVNVTPSATTTYTLSATGNGTTATATTTVTITSNSGSGAPGTGAHHSPQYVTSITGAGQVASACQGSDCIANCPGSGCYTLQGAVGDCSTDDSQAFRNSISAAGSLPLYVPKQSGACYKVTPLGSSGYYSALKTTHGMVGAAGQYPTIKMFGATGGGQAVGGNDAAAIVGIVGGTTSQIIAGIDFDGGGNVQGKIATYGGYPGGEPYASWAFDSCVGVIEAQNVTIRDNFIHDCMGDAVEIEDDAKPYTTGNIAIVSNTMTDVTRQTLGIKGAGTSSTPGLFIADNVIKATWGYGGVNDTEPNNSGDAVWNYEMGWNSCSQTLHTTGWNGTTINIDGAHIAGSGGNIYVHDNTPTAPDNFGHGWCLNSINPNYTNVHACQSPGN